MGVRVRRDCLCPVVVLRIKLLRYMSTRICSCSNVMSAKGYTGQRAGDTPNQCRSLNTTINIPRSGCTNPLDNAKINSYCTTAAHALGRSVPCDAVHVPVPEAPPLGREMLHLRYGAERRKLLTGVNRMFASRLDEKAQIGGHRRSTLLRRHE